MRDPEFLEWLASRLVYVYGESENTDFVKRLKDIALHLRDNIADSQPSAKQKQREAIIEAAENMFNPGEHDSKKTCRKRRAALRDALGLYHGHKGFYINCPDPWHTAETCPSFSCPKCQTA